MSRKFDLCILTGIYPPDTGGPAKFAESFLSWAEENGKRIAIISLTEGLDRKFSQGSSHIELISRNRSFIARFFQSALAIREMMKYRVPILANGMFLEVLVASKLGLRRFQYSCKIPGDIVWERARNSGFTRMNIDEFQSEKLSLKYRIFRKLFSKSLTSASSIVVPSKHLAGLAQRWGVSPKRIHLIPNSIDIDKFAKVLPVNKRFDVITVCRLVPWKGVDQVIAACSRLNLSLVVVGDGPERDNLESLSRKLAAKVTFLGEVSQNQLPSILQQASAFVLNSSFEATSYALIEARAAGLFAIANADTGSEEVINHERDGLLCGRDGYSIDSALRRFKEDSKFTKEAVDLARKDCEVRFNRIRNFSLILDLVADRTSL